MKPIRTLVTAVIFACFAVPALAVPTPPDELVKHVVNEVLDIVKNDKDIQGGDMKKIAALAEQKILPHFDFERMSRITLGEQWKQASPTQRDAFVKEFRSLITRTYSSALTKYRDQTIEYKPLRASPGDADVKVTSLIKQSGGEAIPVEYDLERGSDEWKVFDVVIAGISLVTTYRGQFSSEIRQNGMDALIHKLEEKNR